MPLDILACLRDNDGAEVPYSDLANRCETHEIQGVFVGVASLKDIISAKEFADRDKDREALPELRELDAQTGDGPR